PLVPIPIPRGLAGTPLDWNQIINFPVPAVMQDPNPSTNLKEQVISAYQTQLVTSQNWLYSFVKKNEFFWLSNYATNLALSATVTDSSEAPGQDRKSTRLNSSHVAISYAVFCLKKKKNKKNKY